MWFIGVEVEQETSAPPPNKNSGSARGANNRQLRVVSLGKSKTDSLIQQQILRFFAKIQKVDFESK